VKPLMAVYFTVEPAAPAARDDVSTRIPRAFPH
jgi:hypothetical protein